VIVYSLTCKKGHTFEEWFEGFDDYQAKAGAKKIECPSCGSKSVSKNLSAPAVGGQAEAPAPSCGAPACANGACAFNQG
jgi:hypothetical protein